MPDVLGPTPADDNPYERCNLWMLEDALAAGAEKLCCICLCDGAAAMAPVARAI